MKTLSIDVGGSGIKGMVLDKRGKPVSERIRIPTPKKAKPDPVIAVIEELIARQPPFHRVSIGFPGIVVNGVTMSAPNLDGNWRNVRLAERVAEIADCPCRAINDADMQGFGAIEGKGVEMMITLGTGMGSAVFTEGHLVPNLELGHHVFEKDHTYEERVGDAARRDIGNSKWSKRVLRAIDQILPVWNPRVLYVGGGNTRKLTEKLPDGVRKVDNIAGILGGVRLWDELGR